MKVIKAEYFQSLYDVAAAINSARTVKSVLKTIVEKVAKATEAKGCSLMLLSPDRKLLLHTSSYGLSNSYMRKGPVSAKKSIPEALQGKAIAICDAINDNRIQYQEEARSEGIASILCVPMMLNERVIGVIKIYTQERRRFSETDIYLLQAAAHLGSIALENARLYESLKKDNKLMQQDILEWHAARGQEWVPEEAIQQLLQHPK